MVIVQPNDAFLSFDAKRKFGWPNGYGLAWHGISRYGDFDERAGVYQTYHNRLGQITVRKKFYWPALNSSSAAEVTKDNFRDAVAAWQALSDVDKQSWDDLTYPRFMSGYNRFISLWLRTH